VTAFVGGNITLPCWTTLKVPVDWNYFPPESERGQFVCSAGNTLNGFRKRMKLKRSAPGDFSLTIVNVIREDAGLYICEEDAGLGLKHRIYLNVQGKSPWFYIISLHCVQNDDNCELCDEVQNIAIQYDINISQVICVLCSDEPIRL